MSVIGMLRQLTRHNRPTQLNAVRLSKQFPLRDVTGKSTQGDTAVKTEFFFERSSKRRKGFPSETRVKRGFPSGSL